MTPKEEKAIEVLKSGLSWDEAAQRTGLTVTRLKQLFTQWQEVQQAKNEALAKASA